MLIYGSFEFSSDRSDVWSGKHSIIIEISTGKCYEPALMFNNIEFYEQFWMVSSSCSVTLRTGWRLGYWHRVKALLGGWDSSPSIDIFLSLLHMPWPSESLGKTPLIYKVLLPCQGVSASPISCTTPISRSGLSVLPKRNLSTSV